MIYLIRNREEEKEKKKIEFLKEHEILAALSQQEMMKVWHMSCMFCLETRVSTKIFLETG